MAVNPIIRGGPVFKQEESILSGQQGGPHRGKTFADNWQEGSFVVTDKLTQNHQLLLLSPDSELSWDEWSLFAKQFSKR